jgi:hypothetical protein
MEQKEECAIDKRLIEFLSHTFFAEGFRVSKKNLQTPQNNHTSPHAFFFNSSLFTDHEKTEINGEEIIIL